MAEASNSFLQGLYLGQIEADLVRPFPAPDEDTTETARMVVETWQRFAEDHMDPTAFEAAGEVPRDVLDGMAELGLFGITIPEAYGGFGAPVSTYCRLMEAVSFVDASVSTVIGGHLSLCGKAIMLGGDEAQKRRWLPDMASGAKLGAYALTEPGSGSDARAMQSTAEERDGSWVLNGNKVWCTNAGIAGLITVFARTREGDKTRPSAFVVPAGTEGLVLGKEEDKMGLKASSTRAFAMNDVKVPADHLLGTRGHGFDLALAILQTGRLSLGAGICGASKRMIEQACGHALERHQFGAPIATFELVREKFAGMASNIYAMESVIYLTCGLAESGQGDLALESAVVKVFCTEAGWWTINEALQVAGGMGFVKEEPYERFLRDARVNMIFEGTNEILRSFLCLAGCRAAAGALQGGFHPDRVSFGDVPSPLEEERDAFDRDVAAFAKACARVLAEHREDLVAREYVQARIADAAMALYVRAGCLSRTAALIESRGQEGASAETELCLHACTSARRRLAGALRAIESNQDARTTRVSELVYGAKGYGWDL